jgi:hypothetical protein
MDVVRLELETGLAAPARRRYSPRVRFRILLWFRQ